MKLLKYKVKGISNFFKLRWGKLSNPVLIYQMGKVASSSIFKSLNKVGDTDVFHVHRLNPENISKVQEERLLRGDSSLIESKWIDLYDNLIKTPRTSVKIITLIREPIARNISAYFQNLKSFQGIKDAHDILDVEQLIIGFIEKYNHDVPLEWFDVEMCFATGIDVYQHPFPKQQGYQVIDQAPYHLLIMRHDLDDSLKEKCIGKFLDIESFKLSRFNEASSKKYADTYKKFLDSIKLPTEYVERMVNSKYAQHFYSSEELRAIAKKWTGNNKC